MEISTKMHLLELSTMIHVVRKQIKYILVNERPHDISLVRLPDLICRVYQSVNGRTKELKQHFYSAQAKGWGPSLGLFLFLVGVANRHS